jgi:predicted tellurium resistance membrane protein TerC
VTRNILISIVLIAFTDVALQLDNALAISSVASTVPSNSRGLVLGGGVLLAALFLFTFTFVGSTLIERIGWLKPLAGLALFVIGGKLIYDYCRN